MFNQAQACLCRLLLASLAAFLFSAGARADNNTIVYAALGDSIAAGVGANTTQAYDLSSCGRMQGAYPVLWAQAHQIPASQFSFVACGGAKTTDVINSQLSALSAATTLVTVSAGGNDANGIQTIIDCSPPNLPYPIDGLNQLLPCAQSIATFTSFVQNNLPALLDTMYKQIKAAAPNAVIIANGLHGSFELPPNDGACNLVTTLLAVVPDQQNRQALSTAGQLLNNTIQTVAAANGVIYADPYPFFNGHRICSYNPWINTVVPGLITAYHPTADGYSLGYLPAINAAAASAGF
ncbi:SGNH/GDSL hydrolase family protein [Silvimonas iriomotensis]|uniref:Lipase 1 n=1 Tax=Silvimonas iriomotensis TaxID=449662 RepID=A0ABQ2P899_9NEIS|nr:SGNH/GDSL hydrolase family protein [Silvimonas iriomotensis]GGP20434.1 lipase 1 [Silvimonas iriomotensis]